MKVAVYDTYVKSKNGNVIHFDIMVPVTMKDIPSIYSYGRNYLKSIKEDEGLLSTEECQFCHVENPGAEVISSINEKGYYILEMDEIPAHLPENPTRRDMILYLRAHSHDHRFASFSGIGEQELRKKIALL